MESLDHIVSQFRTKGHSHLISPVNCGHIHETFLAEGEESYIIQRINHDVFPDISGLMHNIHLVTTHLQKRGNAYPYLIPMLVPLKNGGLYFVDGNGGYWRMMRFIPGSLVYDKPQSTEMAGEFGKALGSFILALSDLEAGLLEVLLPGFHDLEFRWEQYTAALKSASPERLKETGQEVRTADRFNQAMHAYSRMVREAGLPVRIIHNDTKFNNLLFNGDQRALALIDLDTVMPGYLLYDFGDAVRTLANKAGEDEKDTCLVRFNLKMYKAFANQFIESVSPVLQEAERTSLTYAPLYITFLQGLRFLTDHLNGDHYYHCDYFGHNLVRAATQFVLLKDMEAKLCLMREVVEGNHC
ncbi:MAG TPA: aminoglycoside phosphotransferase family protein [Bacteroidales bacterium]|nr:aminoglycoside phosphotransferase family protein [Bacteroidales bacterium]